MEKLNTNIHPALTDVLIKKLTKNGINTIADFIQEDVDKLTYVVKQDVAVILNIRENIFKQYSAPLISGTTIFTKYLTEKRYLETGIKRLDAILNGGIPIGFLTEVCGLAGSGKSQLCMQLAIESAKSSSSVLYVDTKGDFSAVRVQKILEAYGLSHKEMAIILMKINIIQIYSMTDLIHLFEAIKTKLLVFNNLSLVMVDSLPCLMFQHFGDDNKIGLKLLNMFVNLARYIANEFCIAVVCVNIETRWVDQERVPDLEEVDSSFSNIGESYIETRNRCLGKYWQHIPALVLTLEKKVQTDNNCINITAENCNNPCTKLQGLMSINSLGVS